MNWRKESAYYQHDKTQRETFALSEIGRIKERKNHNANWLIWAVGPTMYHLPDMLPKHPNVVYIINWGPTDTVLNSATCTEDLASIQQDIRDLIDTHTKYEPFMTLSSTWNGPNQESHMLGFGVIPCVEYDRTDRSDGWDYGDHRYIYRTYLTTHRLVLLSPGYYQTLLGNEGALPHDLVKRGCTDIWRNITRSEAKRTLAFPTADNFTNSEYMKTKAALEYALIHWISGHTAVKYPSFDSMNGGIIIPQETLGTWIDAVHSPHPQTGQTPYLPPLRF